MAAEALSAREALAIVAAQRQQVSRSLEVNVALVHGASGAAWLVGFGVTYLAFGHGGSSPLVPAWAAVVVVGLANAVAITAGLGQTIRRNLGIEGGSWDAMRMYMWAWPIAFAGGYAADAGLQYQGLPVHLAPLLWPGTAAGVCGVLYLAGGLFFHDKIHYALWAWILAATAGSMFAGVPGNFTVLALAGGAGFLVATWRHVRIGKQAGE